MTRQWCDRIKIFSQEGFALPSVLFLVTILSLVILSIVTLKFLNQQTALIAVAQVKADYAALNGINNAIAELNSKGSNILNEEASIQYSFGLHGNATVKFQRWGLFALFISRGAVGKISSDRIALIANHPTREFDNALVFANNNHQLVLAGTTRIIGGVVAGRNGVTVGTLRDLQTPRKVPIEGSVKKESTISLSLDRWKNIVDDMNSILIGGITGTIQQDEIINLQSNGSVQLDSSIVSEKIRYVFIEGDASIRGVIKRRMFPLSIIVSGNLEFQQETSLQGLVAIYSKKNIIVPQNVTIESAILFSQAEIEVQDNSSLSAQLFAPSIHISPSVVLSYPSVVLSFESNDPTKNKQSIILSNSCRIDGTVAMLSASSEENRGVLDLNSGAKVIGAIICEGAVTLDGSVDGTVITKDFYFYESPTTYLGWIRTGLVNRIALPSAFLIPVGFSETDKLDILDWL